VSATTFRSVSIFHLLISFSWSHFHCLSSGLIYCACHCRSLLACDLHTLNPQRFALLCSSSPLLACLWLTHVKSSKTFVLYKAVTNTMNNEHTNNGQNIIATDFFVIWYFGGNMIRDLWELRSVGMHISPNFWEKMCAGWALFGLLVREI
jgi:hypothetical protein